METPEELLRGWGLTDRPAEFDGDIHSWRCSHPDRYGACTCFQEIAKVRAQARREAQAELDAAVAARALREAAEAIADTDGTEWPYGPVIDWLHYRADRIEGEDR